LVHEFGVNTYTQSDNFKVKMAEDYLNDTKPFWADVHDDWNSIERQPRKFGINTQNQSGKLYNQVFNLANEAKEKKLEMGAAAQRAREMIRASIPRDTKEIQTSSMPGWASRSRNRNTHAEQSLRCMRERLSS
jgi:hypothetical protein